AVDVSRGARRAREARAHAFGGVLAHHNFTVFFLEGGREVRGSGPNYRHDPVEREVEVTRGLHRDGNAVRQLVAQLVGAEAARRPRGEQQADDFQVCFTSQADGSKRRSGFAAQLGSCTPWRTAVISARIATAISGGVFEPMYRPTGPR